MSDLVKIIINNPASIEEDMQLSKYWVSFKTWLKEDLPGREIIKSEFEQYDNWNGGTWYFDVDLDYRYKSFYGVPYNNILENDSPSLEEIKEFIELAYDELIMKDRHYDFTVSVNNRLNKFNIPY